MAYDEGLAARARRVLSERPENVTERRMFGGLCFMADGAMCCGVQRDALIVRVGPERYAEALTRPHTRVFDMTGRVSKGMVVVDTAGVRTEANLKKWVELGLAFAATKTQAKPKPRKVATKRRASKTR